MNFKQMMTEKLKANVAYKVANDSNLVREVASIILDDLDYSDIASDLSISSSDIADEIDSSDIISEITDHLDMDDIRQAVAEQCNTNDLVSRVITMLPSSFMDDLAVSTAEEIVAEMNA